MGDQHIMISKHLTEDRGKYSNKGILAEKSERYTRFTPGLLQVNELFHRNANSRTPHHTANDQNTVRFMKCTIII
jgi:hypothetical protein